MSSSITAMAILKYQWVRVASLDRLLLGLADNRNPALTGTLVLPITRYDISDSMFVELVFSSATLELEGTIFVPKGEVIAILKTSDPQDLQRLGYRGRGSAEPAAATPHRGNSTARSVARDYSSHNRSDPGPSTLYLAHTSPPGIRSIH